MTLISHYKLRTHYVLNILLVTFSMLFFTSCNKYKGGQSIPSYVYVDSMYVTTDAFTQGYPTANILDVWVTVDGKTIGAFELPARIPILKKGNHKVEFTPGIMMNQVSGYRVYYPFYKPVIKEIDLVEDSIIRVGTLTTEYVSSIKFDINEDFETAGVVFDTLILKYRNRSDVAMFNVEYTPAEQTVNPKKLFGSSYSQIKLGVNDTVFECISKDRFVLPKGSANIWIELDYYCKNIDLQIGIWSYTYEQAIQQPIFGLKQTNGVWKKAYLCLTPHITNDDSQAIEYYIFMAGIKSNDVKEAEIRIDNFKLIKYETN